MEQIEKNQNREKLENFFKEGQSYFFNYVDRKNYFNNKNRANSSAAIGPPCTRYKPKFSLIENDPKGFDLSQQRVQPTLIEELILKRYKEFEEAMEGLSHQCNPLLRLQNV